MIFTNARLIFPDGVRDGLEVVAREGKIIGIRDRTRLHEGTARQTHAPEEEIVDLGFEDYFYGSGVCVVEWADKADALWPAERLRIRMKLMSETKRGLLFVATGARYCELLRQFQKNTYATASS